MPTPHAVRPEVAQLMDLHPEVAAALAAGGPVVALESTIISHGMPYPQNVEMARGVEAVQKISTRDLPVTVALGGHGATTVASTMRIASLAGVRVFATGGTGGVHRGANESMDVSADLTELARTDVCVVSAGVKSILDIGLTLEVLETQGVPAITLGSPEFPAFYSRQSGFASPLTVQTEAEVARVLHAKWTLGLTGGVLLAWWRSRAGAVWRRTSPWCATTLWWRRGSRLRTRGSRADPLPAVPSVTLPGTRRI
jgi:pseudouridine-5'-phosphate glycosidase